MLNRLATTFFAEVTLYNEVWIILNACNAQGLAVAIKTINRILLIHLAKNMGNLSMPKI